MFVFVLLYGGGIKDKYINEHLERNSLCLLVSVTASRARTPWLTPMTWLMEGEVSVRSRALPGAAVCLGWQQRSPKGPPSHTSAGKAREDVVLPFTVRVLLFFLSEIFIFPLQSILIHLKYHRFNAIKTTNHMTTNDWCQSIDPAIHEWKYQSQLQIWSNKGKIIECKGTSIHQML